MKILHRCMAWLILGTLVATGGCTGYRLGTTLPPGIQTLHVPTFVNQTGEPLIESETTRAAIDAFRRDGTLQIVGRDEADAILTVVVTKCWLEPIRYDRERTKTAREYRLWLHADLELKRRRDVAPMIARKLEAEYTFDFAGDMSSAKRTALPKAAKDLARDIVESVVEYW